MNNVITSLIDTQHEVSVSISDSPHKKFKDCQIKELELSMFRIFT